MPDQAFTGELMVLRRMARVRKGTVVAMFTADERPLLRLPGELLLPDRNPLKHRISVMPITTEPVRLRVRVVDLLTLDGQHLDAIEMSVSVQLNEIETERLLDLAAKRGPQMGHFLNDQVREGIENTARAGIKMTTRAELAERGLAETLRERWLPRSFVGLLSIVDFAVVAEEWAAPTVVHRPYVPTPIPSTSRPAGPTAPEAAELNTDVRLLAAWRRRLPDVPRGVVAARVPARSGAGDEACVIAVVDEEPPAFEGRQLWEDFAGMLEDRHLRLLLCRGRTYEEIVRSWFAQLGLPMRLEVQLRVEVSRDRVEVRLPAELADGLGPQVTALRKLLAGRKLSVSYDEQS